MFGVERGAGDSGRDFGMVRIRGLAGLDGEASSAENRSSLCPPMGTATTSSNVYILWDVEVE